MIDVKYLKMMMKIILLLVTLTAVLLAGSSVYHHYQTKQDKEALLNYLGPNHHFIKTEAGTYSVYEKGSGHDVILFREGLLTGSTILDFMPLADALSKQYKVIMIDPLGYGLSSSATTRRTDAAINQEYHDILTKVTTEDDKITLISHSISAAYTMDYIHRYPGMISQVINIDGSRPWPGLKVTASSQPDHMDFAPVLNQLGLFRIGLSTEWGRSWSGYDKVLAEMTPLYDKELQQQITTLNKWAFLSGDMVQYSQESNNNIAAVRGMKYPRDMRVLSVVASETVKERPGWIRMQRTAFSNPGLQHTVELRGDHYLHHSAEALIEKITEFDQHIQKD